MAGCRKNQEQFSSPNDTLQHKTCLSTLHSVLSNIPTHSVFTHTHTHTHGHLTAFFRTTWVGRYQKDIPFWILLKQEMMGWQWHQLSHMQIICTSLQTDNHHASTSSLHIFLQAGCPSCRPTNSVKALKAPTASKH